MKMNYLTTLIPMLALAGHCVAAPLGTAFTYQGRLYEGSVPASGEYVFQFGLFTSLEGGVNLGTFPPSGPALIVPVTNGLFTTTLDFGASAFRGEARWLQVAVRTNDPASTEMTPLLPRQELKPVPYALHAFSATEATHATNADLAAKVAWGIGSLIGMPAGFADGVDNDTTYTAGLGLSLSGTTFGVNPAFGDGRYWTLAGNSGTDPNAQFLGTIDDRSLTMRVNSRTALRLYPALPTANVIGGDAANQFGAGRWGVFIGGGSSNNAAGIFSTIGGGVYNTASDYASVGGGTGNRAASQHAVVAGGANNQATGIQSTVGGGFANGASATYASVGGGFGNEASGQDSVVAGGSGNAATAGQSTVGGGSRNLVTASQSTVGGGVDNRAGGQDAVVAGGSGNNATAGQSTVGGGRRNTVTAGQGTVSGGADNNVSGATATIAGGQANTNRANYGAVGGGFQNRLEAGAVDGVVAGGSHHLLRGHSGVIGGGSSNTNLSATATIAGGDRNVINTNASAATISGGLGNHIAPVDYGPAIGVANPHFAAIAGGWDNRINGAEGASILGGLHNVIDDTGNRSSILAGQDNRVNWSDSVAFGRGALAQAQTSLAQGATFGDQAGDGQAANYILTGATAGNVTLNLVGPTQLIGSSVAFSALVSAKAFGDHAGGWEVKGVVRSFGGVIALVGAPSVTLLGRTSASLNVTAQVVGDRWVLSVTGISGFNVRWVANVRTAEVQF